MENIALEIAKVIGQPIDANLPVPVELAAICDLETAEYGDDVYYFAAYDTNTDIIYTAGVGGEVTSVRKSPIGATALPLVGFQSDLAYVTLEEMQRISLSPAPTGVNIKDFSALARKKVAITRSMDKYEVRALCTLLLGLTGQEVELATIDDIYTGIMKMVHKVIDYGDNFVLLAGSTVWEAINTYDRDHVQSFNYRLGIKEMMKDFGIEVIKMTGTVALDTTTDSAACLTATKAILVARDSKLVKGKPCLFVRRRIDPAIATQLGFPVDSSERIITTIGGLSIINNSKNILGYGVVGYESIALAVTNSYAIAWCDELTSPA